MALAAQIFRQTQGEQRGASRVPVDLGATIRDDGARPIDATIHDLSVSGFLAETSATLAVDSLIRVGLSGLGSSAARVVWRDGDLHGCAFMRPITAAELALALSAETIEQVNFGGARAAPAEGPEAVPLDTTQAEAAEKWPVAWRLIFVVGASAALWAAIGAGTAALLA